MATGSGKTFTAISVVYRMIKHGGAHRVLFLVDRKNLGTQALTEFQLYTSPTTGAHFTDEYTVQHLRSNAIDPASRVVITTIQRLYALIRNEPNFDEESEEHSTFEAAPPAREAVPLAYNPRIPIGTFDVIVVDEYHRAVSKLLGSEQVDSLTGAVACDEYGVER